jgi:SAM-dependent methyltransferase
MADDNLVRDSAIYQQGLNYQQVLAREKDIFENCLDVHDLPEIYHYWSCRFLRPKLLPFGFDSANAMFAKYLEEQCLEATGGPKRFVSLGSGNCELEIELARKLNSCGHEAFIIDCVELNPAMLARGRAAATAAGVADHLEFSESDLNSWSPACDYDAVFANQSLHHVVNLEGLFEEVRRSLKARGSFIIADIIGRNGHLRWPEALQIVHEFWRKLPPSYRYNPRMRRYEELFEDWDCSVEGFEGIRAQDILPLLLREFHFRLFVPFGNIIDPFVDRSFGPHFDPTAQWDRAFIDEVHQRDEAEIFSGALTPTHILAVVTNDHNVVPVFPGNLSPGFCVRMPSRPDPASTIESRSAYDWHSWPHPSSQELEIACARLAEASRQAVQLETEVRERTLWARRLEKELEDQVRTAGDQVRWAIALGPEFEERTAWALRLRDELAEKTLALSRLERELHGYLHNPLRFFARLARGVFRRVRRMLAA